MFEILVVGSDYTVGLPPAELFEHGFGDGSANLRFGARTEFVNEDKCTIAGLPNHVFHVEQVAGVSRQVVFKTLLVSDVYHDVVEDARDRPLAYGDRQATLQHVL